MANVLKKRMGLIGLGSIAQKAYLPIITNHPKIAPVFCTRNVKVLNTLADTYRVGECYTDIDTLIKSRPHAAMVHTSTESHYKIVKALLTHRIPVFVDKPICYTLKETEALLDLAIATQTPLCVGFNRRYAPLIADLKKKPAPLHVHWQKHRVNIPADPRVFIFDDFIHVVDSLRFLSHGKVEDLQVFPGLHNGLLEHIHVQWRQEHTLLSGTMNRVSGITEERLEYFTHGHKWEIHELESGYHCHNESKTPLSFDPWTPTLHKRGFYHLIEDWLQTLEEVPFNTQRLDDIFETHRLCEVILNKALKHS
ncbi:Gfo/Idh/MocA family protein [Aestuariivivens sediminis]|uniref:Gfo/Idh/MocA family protein n=1 Tax=Aestuariivivens sediminis TaxID=2913557 RepID=UPI001F5A9AB7|nr:Gfo/Idh/MocA family oxidoreductase [Aestuariivivens sediminis]